MPIIRLTHNAPALRRRQGLSDLSSGQWFEIMTFREKVKQLALCLRELHKQLALGSAPPHLSPVDNPELFSERIEAQLIVPLFVHLAFNNLRSIADHFARAIRHVLFKHLKSCPADYKGFRDGILTGSAVTAFGPTCDPTLLRDAVSRHSGWFDELRYDEGQGRKGIREIIEHDAFVSTYHIQENNGPWEVVAQAGDPHNPAMFRGDLIPKLKDLVKEVSELWTAVCEVAGLEVASDRWIEPIGDALLLCGDDADSTSFWPEI